MGTCVYCQNPAGFLRKKHAICNRKHREGKEKILEFADALATPSSSIDTLVNQIKQIAENSYISQAEQKDIVLLGWQQAVENALDEAPLTQEYEQHLEKAMSKLSITREDLMKDEATFLKIVQSLALRDILEGIIPPRSFRVEGSLPVNLQKGEIVVWAFSDSSYYEDRVRRECVGGSQSVSFRVAKGVYYRVGAFKGTSVDKQERKHIDTGVVVLTTKHIYFVGPRKSFRVPYAKIVSFQAFSDGIGIVRDAMTAKPQIFVTKDGWFTYNVVSNLAERARV